MIYNMKPDFRVVYNGRMGRFGIGANCPDDYARIIGGARSGEMGGWSAPRIAGALLGATRTERGVIALCGFKFGHDSEEILFSLVLPPRAGEVLAFWTGAGHGDMPMPRGTYGCWLDFITRSGTEAPNLPVAVIEPVPLESPRGAVMTGWKVSAYRPQDRVNVCLDYQTTAACLSSAVAMEYREPPVGGE